MTGDDCAEVLVPAATSTLIEMVYPPHPDNFEVFQTMDHMLPPEGFGQEFSYTPSPDSLFMYEQERQADALGYACPTASEIPLLRTCMPPLEQSDNMYSLSSGMELGDDSEVNGNGLGQVNWDIKDMDFVKMEDVFQDSSDVNQGPTLAQLNSFIGDKQRHSVQGMPSAVPVSNTEQWNTGILDDWNSDSNRCSPIPSNSQQGFITLSNSKNWKNSSSSQGIAGTSTSRRTDEAYPSQVCQGSMDRQIQRTMIKQEPCFDSQCSAQQQSRFQSPSISQTVPHKDHTGTSLHRMLLQGRFTGHQTPGSPSPPVSPAKHTLPPTATVCKSEPIRNSDDTVDKLWEEVKQYIHDDMKDTSSALKIKRERLDSGSSVITSMEELETRDAESVDSDNGEEEYLSDQYSSDSDEAEHISPGASKSKEKQYFWQYNVQSKGPKGKKLCLSMNTVDPHVLPNFEDPVFDPDYKVPGISHGGKARRGDGNNVFPNPKKLCQIGNELKKLNRRISEYGPLNDMPSALRNKSRKEKNKLASRACRLKKKAQHEANKVKLMGLEQEHSQLMTVISLIKSDTLKRLSKVTEDEENLSSRLEDYISTHIKRKIAGNTTEFVNQVIQKVNSGDTKGGLEL